MPKKIVYVTLSQFCEASEEPRRWLLEAGFEVRENRTGRRIKAEEMLEALKDADAVLAAVEPYDAALLEKLPRLKCISRCGIGTDAIDLEAARRRNIAVRVTVDEIVEPVAQMAVGMMLAMTRNFPQHQNDFQNRLWKKHTGFLLSEWTIGLIGFGKIARKVEEYLRPFAPKILVNDPFLNASQIPSGLTLCPLDRLLAQSDCVSLHAARSPQEGPLLGDEQFSKMKKGSVLINTARGYLVDEGALLKALQSGPLAGAALDVFEQEPYTGPFATLPNVLCTPHVGTLTRASRAAMELRCAQNVVEHFGCQVHAPGTSKEIV